ncbi:MAG: membrane protein insertion efficiency factor YidD [Christensenellales bacterium]
MKRVIIAIIWFYKRAISPYTGQCCRFTPSCSDYALQAVEKHGAFKGAGLAVLRLVRCNPLCKGGFDPVP